MPTSLMHYHGKEAFYYYTAPQALIIQTSKSTVTLDAKLVMMVAPVFAAVHQTRKAFQRTLRREHVTAGRLTRTTSPSSILSYHFGAATVGHPIKHYLFASFLIITQYYRPSNTNQPWNNKLSQVIVTKHMLHFFSSIKACSLEAKNIQHQIKQ